MANLGQHKSATIYCVRLGEDPTLNLILALT